MFKGKWRDKKVLVGSIELLNIAVVNLHRNIFRLKEFIKRETKFKK